MDLQDIWVGLSGAPLERGDEAMRAETCMQGDVQLEELESFCGKNMQKVPQWSSL